MYVCTLQINTRRNCMNIRLTCDQASLTFSVAAGRYAATKNIRDAWSQVRILYENHAWNNNPYACSNCFISAHGRQNREVSLLWRLLRAPKFSSSNPSSSRYTAAEFNWRCRKSILSEFCMLRLSWLLCCYFDNVMTHFILNKRTDAYEADVKSEKRNMNPRISQKIVWRTVLSGYLLKSKKNYSYIIITYHINMQNKGIYFPTPFNFGNVFWIRQTRERKPLEKHCVGCAEKKGVKRWMHGIHVISFYGNNLGPKNTTFS